MGLFGNIFKGVVGAIPILGSAVSGAANSKAVKNANAATQAGITQGIGALNGAFNAAQTGYAPYQATGTSALGQQSDLLGLNGTDAQAGGIAGLKASPLFQALFNTGQETILQNGAATGGLRGGNMQAGLAEFGSNTLAQVIQQQLGNLGGISSQGLSATNNLSSLGQANAGAIAGLYGQSGAANAGSILGRQNIQNQTTQQIAGQVQSLVAGGFGGIPTGGGAFDASISNLLGSLKGGGAGAGIAVNPAAVAGASGGSIFNRGGF